MRDYLDIGPTPAGEDCEQLGPNYNPVKAKQECRAFINQLRRIFGNEEGSANFKIQSNPHDFGTYLSVICSFNDDDEIGAEYAYNVENNTPELWDEQALTELGLQNN